MDARAEAALSARVAFRYPSPSATACGMPSRGNAAGVWHAVTRQRRGSAWQRNASLACSPAAARRESMPPWAVSG